MKTVVLERRDVLAKAAGTVCAVINGKPNAVITMAAGRTMEPLWELRGEMVQRRKLSFRDVTFFQTAEFIGAPADKTLRRLLEGKLLEATDLDPMHCFWLSEENVEGFDEEIRKAGGLDLAVLGIGDNAHIGFNEPAVPYNTRCRIQKLTERTKQQYKWLFGTTEDVPDKACTMGIRTLVEAKKIIVLTLGAEKAKATFDMLYARDDSAVPAAFLQLPFDVTVYADKEAGAKL